MTSQVNPSKVDYPLITALFAQSPNIRCVLTQRKFWFKQPLDAFSFPIPDVKVVFLDGSMVKQRDSMVFNVTL